MNRRYITDRVVYEAKSRCWLWTGATNNANYPMAPNGVMAHRAAYELWIGPIPEGCDLDHTCRRGYGGNKWTGNLCVNPDHMNPISRSEHNHLTYTRRKGQMPFSRLRIARHLHTEVGRH